MHGSRGKQPTSSSQRLTVLATCFAIWLLAFAALSTAPHTVVHAAAKPAAGDAKAGEALFQQKCFQCHAVAEGEVRFGPSLYHELKKPKPKKTDAEARLIIKNGKNKMPAWGAILTPEQTDNIVAYLHTL